MRANSLLVCVLFAFLTLTSAQLPVVNNLLGGNGLPVVGGLLGGNGLPVVGNLLGGNGLPVVGNLLGGNGLPVVGNLLGGNGLPVVGNLLGGNGLPVVGNLLGGNGLPVVGNLLGGNGLPVVGNLLGGNGLPVVNNVLPVVNNVVGGVGNLVGGVVGTVDGLLHDILKDLDLNLDVDLQIPGLVDVDLNAVVAGDINVDGFVDVLGITVPLDVHVHTRRDLISDLLDPLFLGGSNGFLPGLSLGNIIGGVISVVDYNLDNILDLLICGLDNILGTPVLSLLQGNGNGTFVAVPQPLLPVNVDVSAALWSDIDLDGDLDLVITGLVHVSVSSDVAVTQVYLNVNGTLTLYVNLQGLFLDPAIAVADINNDAFPDIILTGSVSATIPQPTTIVYLNNAGNSFIQANVNILGVINAALAVGDLNNDGWIDLVISGNTGITAAAHVYLNQNGIFVAANVQLLGVISGDIELADLNNDGLLDIALTGSLSVGGAITKVYVNTGAGLFVDLGLGLRALVSGDLLLADVNVDLCLDLMLTGEVALGNPTTLVYVNTACGTSANVSAPSPVPNIYFQWLNPTDLKIWWDPIVGANTFNLAVMLGVNLNVLNVLDVDINVDADINLGVPADWIISPLAIPQLGGYRLIPAQGNMGPRTFTIIRGLDQTLTYVFGVQSIAANLLGSIFNWGCTGPDCSACTVC